MEALGAVLVKPSLDRMSTPLSARLIQATDLFLLQGYLYSWSLCGNAECCACWTSACALAGTSWPLLPRPSAPRSAPPLARPSSLKRSAPTRMVVLWNPSLELCPLTKTVTSTSQMRHKSAYLGFLVGRQCDRWKVRSGCLRMTWEESKTLQATNMKKTNLAVNFIPVFRFSEYL